MSYYTKFASGVLFPLHERVKGHTSVAVRKEMERSQWFGPAELEQLRIDRLRSFLITIGRDVPYYNTLFSELGFLPEEVTSLGHLAQLPLLDKPIIRANTEVLKSSEAANLARFNTGGSSGEPLIFYIGKQRVSHDVAAKWRATRWWGVDIGDPEIVVWGSPIELGSQDHVRQIRDGLFRTQLLPAFEMSESKLDSFLETIRSTRPRMLFGYPSALAVIAEHAKKRGLSMDDVGLRVAFVTSECLYDHQREAIEQVFACPVANGYGGRDAGFIAHQCPSGNMHITAEDIIVEIIDEEGRVLPPGEPGQIVVTHMATSDFPFVRYLTGDVGSLSDKQCPCGRGLPLLEEIQGRTTDFVIAQDGSMVHGLALIYILRDLPGIRSFKLVQESLSEIRVFIVAGEGFEQAHESAIQSVFWQRLGVEVGVLFEYVDEIPVEKSGKFRYVVSRVRH